MSGSMLRGDYQSETNASLHHEPTGKIVLLNPINELVEEILTGECIQPVYQPIVSLKNGVIYGYEALSRITLSDCHLNIEELFEAATRANKLWELEVLCRTQALKGAYHKPARIKLFLNVDPNIIYDSEFISGFTKEKLLSLGLNSKDIIFEITEKVRLTRPMFSSKLLIIIRVKALR